MTTANSEVKKTLVALGERTGTYLVDKRETSTTWYRKYSDGWVEQGGTGSASNANPATITFPISFLNDNFSFSVTNKKNTNVEGPIWNIMTVKSSNKTSVVVFNHGGTDPFSWFACGYS